MKTKDHIKKIALELFNSNGVFNTTLRDVAQKMNKSYGNITYHFPKKDVLIATLYQDMIEELSIVSNSIINSQNIFISVLEAPAHTFDLSIKYLFFFKDFVEIKRNYPTLAHQIETSQEARKEKLRPVLQHLRTIDIIQPEITDDELDFLMETSGALRTYFFLNLTEEKLKNLSIKQEYMTYVNKVLPPYLSSNGKKLYSDFSETEMN